MPRIKQFKESEVLRKAMELFWEKGFHATSMQDLVSYLGINRASLYGTFGGKTALFEKALQLYLSDNYGYLRQFLDAHEDVKTGFIELLNTAILESVDDENRKGCFVVNTTTELIPGNQEIQEKLLLNKSIVEGIFAEYLEKGKERGQFAPDADVKVVAAFLFTLYSGLRVVTKLDTDPNYLRAVIERALSVLDENKEA